MGMIKVPKGFLPGFGTPRIKPSGPIVIDWNNPLTRGLEYCLPCNSPMPVNIANGVPDTLNGSVKFTGDSFSWFEATSSDYISVNTPFDKQGGQFSLVVMARFGNPAAGFPVLAGRGDTGSDEWMFGDATTGGNEDMLRLYAAGGQCNASGSFIQDRQQVFAFSYGENGNNGRVYGDGRLIGSDTTGSALDTSTNTKDLTIGGADQNGTRNFGGDIYLVLGYSRALTDAEHLSLSRDPYQVLKPANDLYYFPVSAAGDGAIELTPSNGVINAVGNTPAVTASLSLSPSNGGINVAGNTPTVTSALSLSPSNGVVNAVGNTPTVTIQEAAIELTPSNGVINVTGNTPTIGLTLDIAPQNGRIDVVGNTPEITRIIDLRPDNGAVNVNGNTPTISVVNGTSELEPSTGRIDAVGNTPVLTQLVTLQPESGLITVIGNTPSISIEADAVVLSPSVGRINVSGNTPTVSLSLGGPWSPVESASGTWSAVTTATGTWQRV